MTETAAPGGTPVGTIANYPITYQSEMIEVEVAWRDDFEETYIVGLDFKFADSNDDVLIRLPGYDSMTVKTRKNNLSPLQSLIGFSIRFTKNIHLHSTLVLKTLGRFFDNPTV